MAQRPPSPGDEATPFLLRIYVKPAPFRPLDDFHPDRRPARDEFKLYVWKTNTLREVTQMLHDADLSVSTPLATHAFRRIHWDDDAREFTATSVGAGITRIPLESLSSLLADLDDETVRTNGDVLRDDEPAQLRSDPNTPSTTSLLGWDKLSDEIDESAAAISLAQLHLADGDVLDCVVKPDPSLASAPTMSRPTHRERPHSADRFSRR